MLQIETIRFVSDGLQFRGAAKRLRHARGVMGGPRDKRPVGPVDDVHELVHVLKEEGCNVLEKIDESEYGKFAWVIDPEGNKVELWEPPEGQ